MKKVIAACLLSALGSSSASAAALYNRLPDGFVSVCADAAGKQCEYVPAGGRLGGLSIKPFDDLAVYAGKRGPASAGKLCSLGKAGLEGGDVLVVSLSGETISCEAYHADALTKGLVTGKPFAAGKTKLGRDDKNAWTMDGKPAPAKLKLYLDQLHVHLAGGR